MVKNSGTLIGTLMNCTNASSGTVTTGTGTYVRTGGLVGYLATDTHVCTCCKDESNYQSSGGLVMPFGHQGSDPAQIEGCPGTHSSNSDN